jgi:ABC-2 type transport system permease protein
MVVSDFKIRYQGSMLGYAWSLLKPLFFFSILYVVFTYIIPLGKGIEHYPVYLLLGIVLWSFFTESTTLGASSIVSRSELIRKISIPRYLIVISSTLSALINLCLNLAVVFLFAILSGIEPSLNWILIIPLIIELAILSMGCALFLSAYFVKFRDVTYIWEIILQAGFYATPIIYPISSLPIEYHKYFFINPIAQIIQDARHAIATDTAITIWNTVENFYSIVPFFIVAAFAIFGWYYFKKKSKYFAEDI